jgi:putative CocE/NonD family hydrolase
LVQENSPAIDDVPTNDRLLSLSDGVFAFAMTLLTLGIILPTPDKVPAQELPKFLFSQGAGFFIWVLSFLVIGMFWRAHHSLFNELKSHDDMLILFNLFFLLSIAFMPYPTQLIGHYAASQFAVVLYSADMFLASVLMALIALRALHSPSLLKSQRSKGSIQIALARVWAWRSSAFCPLSSPSSPRLPPCSAGDCFHSSVGLPRCHLEELGMRIQRNLIIEVRDGARLSADLYLPEADGPFPTLFAASPYRKDLAGLPVSTAFRFRETGPIEWWTEQGYAYLLADLRGTGISEGEFGLWSRATQADLYDIIEWAARQSWSNSKVGMTGESGYGITQWFAAVQRPPHLACVLSYNAGTDFYRDAMYHGGIFSGGFFQFWTMDNLRASALIGELTPPNREALNEDLLGMVLQHSRDDEFWSERNVYRRLDQIDVPTFVIGFWSNVGLHLRGSINGYEQVRSSKRLLMIGGRIDSQELQFDEEFLRAEFQPWDDRWLKGIDNGVMDGPPVRIMVQHKEQKPDWRDVRTEAAWPLERVVPTPYYLQPGPAGAVHSLNDGALSMDAPTADRSSTSYSYPNPAWTVGTTVIGANGIPNPVRAVLTFCTEPVREDVEVTGPIAAVLYASSSAGDTEFFVKISEQFSVPALRREIQEHLAGETPPPAAMVSKGWLKASHRQLDEARSQPLRPYHVHTSPEPLAPETVYRFDIEVWPTSYRFSKGSRIRIEIAPGDSQIADGLFWHYYGHKVGTDTIYHDREYPSHVLLPIVPA